MPYVVVDTSVSLPATLSPGGLTRKFWVLLAFGALTHDVEHGKLELDYLEAEARNTGARVGGIEAVERLVASSEANRAALGELLPDGAPDDWLAIGSEPLFEEYERKVREIGHKLEPQLQAEDAPRLRRQMEAVCRVVAPAFDPKAAPRLTPDPTDDSIVFAALLADADFLVSDDRHIVPDGVEKEYEHDEHRVRALAFNTLVTDHLEVAWDKIDGRWLPMAYR